MGRGISGDLELSQNASMKIVRPTVKAGMDAAVGGASVPRLFTSRHGALDSAP